MLSPPGCSFCCCAWRQSSGDRIGDRRFVPCLFGVSLGARERAPDVFHCVATFYSESRKMWSSPFHSGFWASFAVRSYLGCRRDLKALLTHYFVAYGLLEREQMLMLWRGFMSRDVRQMPVGESISPSFRNLIRAGWSITLHNVLALIIHSRTWTLPRQYLCDSVAHV